MAAVAEQRVTIWRPIAGHVGYEVGDSGEVRSVDRLIVNARGRWGVPMPKRLAGRTLRTWRSNSGYLMVCLGARCKRYVHHLVAEAFVPRAGDRDQINHKDGNRTNNAPCNLEWVTQSENMKHATHVLGKRGGQFGPNRHRHERGAIAC